MTLRVTIDIFSGRPNPVFELTAKEARVALEMLKPVSIPRKSQPPPLPPTILGYRGIVIEQVGRTNAKLPRQFRVAAGFLYGPRLRGRLSDEAFEEFICGSTGPRRLGLGQRFPKFCVESIDRFKRAWWDISWKDFPFWPIKPVCTCAPLYEPSWWNDGGQRQYNNNCYNYATNYRTDTFAQPGQAAGAMYTALTCASVRPAAVADALINNPLANNRCPKEGHLVALVIAPGWDFHWYRKGRNGRWTHKPGGTQATNLDNSGALISDPRTADRGAYTDFCTFMTVMHGHIKIR